MLVMGSPFFTSAYMLVDNDNEEITLWQAQATTDQNLVAVGTPDCTPTPTPSPSTSSTPSTTPTSILHSAVARATISNEAIAGAIIGGLIGVAIVVGAFLLIRRRHRKNPTKIIKDHIPDSPDPPPSYTKPELASDLVPPLEMPLIQHTGYMIAPYELSEGREYGELPSEPPPVPEKEAGVAAYEMSSAPKTPKKGSFRRI